MHQTCLRSSTVRGYVISRFTVNSAHHASGVVKAIGSFLFGVDVRFEEQDVQGDFTEATYIFLLMNDFMDFHAGFSFMYPHVPKIAPYCPTPSDTPLAEPRILQWPCKGLANGLGTFTRRRFAKSNHLCLVGSLNTYDHYRIPDEFQQFILHNVIMSASQESAAFWEFCKARWPSNESGPTMRFNERSLSTIWLLCIDVEKRVRFFNHTNQKDPEKAESEQGKVKHTSPCQDPRGFPPAV